MISKFIKPYSSRNISTLAVIDIGETKVACLLYEINERTSAYKLIARVAHPSVGFNKGEIVDLAKSINTIEMLLDGVESISRVRVDDVIISAPYLKTKLFQYPYACHVNGVITENDINNITSYNAYQKVVNKDSFIISLKINKLYIDDKIVENPVGLYAKKITADVTLVSAFTPYIINISKILEYLSLNLRGIIYAPLALSYFYDNNMMNVFVNIGKTRTVINISQGNTLEYLNMLDIGVDSILIEVANRLNIQSEILLGSLFQSNYINYTKGKIMNISYEGINHKIAYSEYIKSLDFAVLSFFRRVALEVNKYGVSENSNISIFGEDLDMLLSNDLFTKHINSNMILQKQISKESLNYEVGFKDIRSLSLLKYYVANMWKDSAMMGTMDKISQLNIR